MKKINNANDTTNEVKKKKTNEAQISRLKMNINQKKKKAEFEYGFEFRIGADYWVGAGNFALRVGIELGRIDRYDVVCCDNRIFGFCVEEIVELE